MKIVRSRLPSWYWAEFSLEISIANVKIADCQFLIKSGGAVEAADELGQKKTIGQYVPVVFYIQLLMKDCKLTVRLTNNQ